MERVCVSVCVHVYTNQNLATATEPTLATSGQLTGTSYTVIMVDLDIPTTTNPHTFLHWMQTDLVPSTSASAVTASNGTLQAFTLTNAKSVAAIVNYTQPSPPAQNPLSHRYTEVLLDTSSISAAALTALKTAAQSRVGFDIATVLQGAGLTSSVVAGNSFNVTNAGPATDAAAAVAAGTNATTLATAVSASSSTTKTKKNKANKTKAANKTKTGAAAAQVTGAGGKKGSKGQATNAAGMASTSATATAGLPAATGATISNDLNSTTAAKGSNSTGTVTTSDAVSDRYTMVYPVTLVAAMMGAFFYVL